MVALLCFGVALRKVVALLGFGVAWRKVVALPVSLPSCFELMRLLLLLAFRASSVNAVASTRRIMNEMNLGDSGG